MYLQANHGKKRHILNLCLVSAAVRLFRVSKVCELGGVEMLVLSRREGESIEFRDLNVLCSGDSAKKIQGTTRC